MDFFERQDAARRNTRRLVILFGVAVVLIVVAVNLAARLIFLGASTKLDIGGPTGLFHPPLVVAVTVATLAVILIGSLYKMASLREGGAAVARLMGGRPVDPNTDNDRERRLLNIVEEMAIASGAPVPDVYVLDKEAGINAFAAGLTPADAVVAVSAGCLEHLSRDELQGVVAHELSHIVNGDMRLNLRLMGILHGILVIALIGGWVMYSMQFSAIGGRSSRREGGGVAMAILVFGVALLAVGWIGRFFGRMIKSGVSRQREFLADSAGAQFTRNPSGLADALKKIGGLTQGSRLQNKNAEQASHLFFANGLRSGLTGLLASHPPLGERILRLEPGWKGAFPALDKPSPDDRPPASAVSPAPPAAGVAALSTPTAASASPSSTAPGGTPRAVSESARILDSVGNPSAAHLAYSREVLAGMPAVLLASAKEPSTARCVVFGLLLDRSPAEREHQLRELAQTVDPLTYRQTLDLAPHVDRVPVEGRLPLIDLTLIALRRLSQPQYESFTVAVDTLIEADNQVSLFELTLRLILRRNLDPAFGRRPRPPGRGISRQRLFSHGSVLLSALAHAGGDSAKESFTEGARVLGAGLRFIDRAGASLEAAEESLRVLAQASPTQKRSLLEAAITIVIADRAVTVDEGELLRAIAEALDCPVPPLLPGRLLA